jgi:hypothetical protein
MAPDVPCHGTINGEMMKALLLLSAVAATSIATTLTAQDNEKLDSVARRTIVYRMDSTLAKRAALGIELRPTGTRRDTLGVFVEAVTPKGPAEIAGIVEGDRIAAINGVDLRTAAADVDDSYTNGLAAHRLGREVQKLTPGSRVTLRVYSGGRFRDVQVTAAKASDLRRLGGRFNFRIPGHDGMLEFHGPDGMMMLGPELRQKIELDNLPARIQIRRPSRFRTLAPAVAIRDLFANAIRDAQSALRHLGADAAA